MRGIGRPVWASITTPTQAPSPCCSPTASPAWRCSRTAPGALIINIGDMVQVWSNDAYVAPLHRVQAMESHDRLSLAFFFNPAYSAVVAPLPKAGEAPRYHGIPWAEFRRRRADGDFADYGAEVQIGDYRLADPRATRPPR